MVAGWTDVGRRALTIAAVAVPALARRWLPATAAGCSHLMAHQACSIVKHLANEERPDGSDDLSFPSSHALETFSAATSLALAFGKSLGLPAFAAAGWVSYGRLQADRHHLRDVLVGGLAGAASAWLSARAVSWAGEIVNSRAASR